MRYLLLAMALSVSAPVAAGEIILMDFELASGSNTLHRGKAFITEKKDGWSKGLRRSYLRLRCEKKDREGVRRIYSTEDVIDGLIISHIKGWMMI